MEGFVERELFDFIQRNNINIQKVFIYKNFVTYVHRLMFETYVGDDYMTEESKEAHYNFCWDEVSKEMNFIGIDFSVKINARDWFKKIAFRLFYNKTDKQNELTISKTSLRNALDVMFNINDITINKEYLLMALNKFENG